MPLWLISNGKVLITRQRTAPAERVEPWPFTNLDADDLRKFALALQRLTGS